MSDPLGAAGFLLGFPTPIVEVILVLVGLFVVLATYLGTQMEGIEDVTETETETAAEHGVGD